MNKIYSNSFMWAYKRVMPKKITTSKEIKIAVIDSGVDNEHPEIKNNVLQGRDYLGDNTHGLIDTFGHGTQVSGVILILNRNVKIIPYKVMKEFNDGISLNIIKAIYDAIEDGAKIINISLGSYKNPNIKEEKYIIDMYIKAIQYAKENNVIIVASAGNEGNDLSKFDKIHVPGGLEGVVSVGASTRNGNLANYSNYGLINIVAPAGNYEYDNNRKIINVEEMVFTYTSNTSPFNVIGYMGGLTRGYTFSFGTSIATPFVTAALSVIIGNNYNITTGEALRVLYNNAESTCSDERLNEYKEVRIR